MSYVCYSKPRREEMKTIFKNFLKDCSANDRLIGNKVFKKIPEIKNTCSGKT